MARQDLPGMSDFLLHSFSAAQKDYIIKHLYPELSKALIHFISEAKRHNQINEENTFGGSPGAKQEQPVRKPSQSNFGGFKMGQVSSQAQPSNL